ncbi:hypothetical protein [Edaphobacter dinghuensis]|uniref:Uncharacterized protein n=1 Tax=Edaphobacter dinghuensis TaxID=1560005 RepID=A0A917HET9_9BACT|nr:hypothetical protein [Edaphobacter dinghuensis]GGG76970.1 hypothetical protein GCM10011585_19970 [Edaphobacter dinghuensis]
MHKPVNIEKRQFRILYKAFLLRVVDLELLSADADTTRLLGQFAALFAGISYLFTFWLIFAGGRFSPDFLWVMEHFLIATTMLVVGLFSVLCWESIFPDRGDVLVLAPLPVRVSTLFRAKLSALIAALSLSVLSLNCISGLVWPKMFSATNGGGYLGMLHSLVAYWATMLLAATFVFGCVLGIQGITSQLLPRAQFLRLSALLQVFLFFLFTTVYIIEPSLEAPKALVAPENQRLLAWLPSYWFLGLFQQLNGSMLPAFAPLARRAWVGIAVATVVGAISVLLAYFRVMGKIIETPDIAPGGRRVNLPLRFGTLLQTAVVLFSVRTLLRSRQHRMLLSFYLGATFAIVLAYLGTSLRVLKLLHGTAGDAVNATFLVASIWIMCFAIMGVRLVISMPLTLRANWIFRITEIRGATAYLSAIRRAFFVLAAIPAWLLMAILFLLRWPTWRIVGHLFLLALVGMIVVELSLYGFHKLPFTCSYLPGQSKVHVVFWGCLLVWVPLVAARFEMRILSRPLDFIGIAILLILIAACARWRTTASAASVEGLIFEEEYPPELFSLNLLRNMGAPLTRSNVAGASPKSL